MLLKAFRSHFTSTRGRVLAHFLLLSIQLPHSDARQFVDLAITTNAAAAATVVGASVG